MRERNEIEADYEHLEQDAESGAIPAIQALTEIRRIDREVMLDVRDLLAQIVDAVENVASETGRLKNIENCVDTIERKHRS